MSLQIPFVPRRVDTRLQAAQLGRNAVQIFGVAHEQEAVGREVAHQARDHPALGRNVKINQDIAAKNGAASMAVMRAACSAATDSSSAWKI